VQGPPGVRQLCHTTVVGVFVALAVKAASVPEITVRVVGLTDMEGGQLDVQTTFSVPELVLGLGPETKKKVRFFFFFFFFFRHLDNWKILQRTCTDSC
jgi:hypothetical protein